MPLFHPQTQRKMINQHTKAHKVLMLFLIGASQCSDKSEDPYMLITAITILLHQLRKQDIDTLYYAGLDKKKNVKWKIFSYPSVLTYVLGAQKNSLIETVILSTQNLICFG